MDGVLPGGEIALEPQNMEVVLGLHWDPDDAGPCSAPVDLDALCVLYAPDGEVREVIHPGHPCSRDGSVVHTGDSRTGASVWDDERVFVFLAALPADIVELAFIVISASPRSFDQVRGASCHLSDRVSETEWVRTDLTALTGHVACTVATLRRDAAAWRIVTDAQPFADELPHEVRLLLDRSKPDAAPHASAQRRQ